MRNLLITTVGKDNHLATWLKGKREFDVAIINYDGVALPSELIGECVYYNVSATFKYMGIYAMMNSFPQLKDYDYFWMPDEDIDMSTEDINAMFDTMDFLDIDLAQPSIDTSEGSYPSWQEMAHDDGTEIRYTNFIEIMCPCFSKIALIKCLNTFTKSYSGWGLDLVWPTLIGDNHKNIAVLNNIIARHTRPVKGGRLYDALAKRSLSPSFERKKLMAEYGIKAIDIKIYP